MIMEGKKISKPQSRQYLSWCSWINQSNNPSPLGVKETQGRQPSIIVLSAWNVFPEKETEIFSRNYRLVYPSILLPICRWRIDIALESKALKSSLNFTLLSWTGSTFISIHTLKMISFRLGKNYVFWGRTFFSEKDLCWSFSSCLSQLGSDLVTKQF